MNGRIFVLLCFLVLTWFWVTTMSTALDLSGAVVSPQYVFADPAVQNVSKRFNEVHNTTETFYNSDGTWYAVPSATRWSARAALGYMSAYRATNDTIYATRSKEALQHLVNMQGADGFWGGSGLETGLAGAAMVEGYMIFGNPSYFQSSKQAADAELSLAQGNCTGELNNCAYMLWHLAGQYEITGEGEYLDKAVEMAQHVISFQDQGSGTWPNDHGGDFRYHTMYSRALVELVRVTPTDHPFEKSLIEATVRTLNHTIIMQHSSGNFYQDVAKTTLATASSGTHPRAAHMTHVFINELGLDKIQDVLDGLTLYTMSLDLGTMGNDERLMTLYATGTMLEAYGGTIIDLFWDPSMVTTTTTTLAGGEEEPVDPGSGGEPPIEENTTTTTSTTTTTTQATPQATTTTNPPSPINQIIDTTMDAVDGMLKQPMLPILAVLIIILGVVAYSLMRNKGPRPTNQTSSNGRSMSMWVWYLVLCSELSVSIET